MKDGKVVQIGTPAELVLSPADDYVMEFTQDVPRVRVITAGEIVINGGSTDGLPRVDASSNLEQIMPMFGDHPEGLAVESDGEIIGLVTPQAVVNALASESNANGA